MVEGEVAGESLARETELRVERLEGHHLIRGGEADDDTGARAAGDGEGLVDREARRVDENVGRARENDALDADESHGALGGQGIAGADANQADPPVREQHALGERIRVAAGQLGWSAPQKRFQSLARKDVGGRPIRQRPGGERDVAFERQEVGDVEAEPGERHLEHATHHRALGGAEPDGNRAAAQVDRLVDGGAGGVDPEQDACARLDRPGGDARFARDHAGHAAAQKDEPTFALRQRGAVTADADVHLEIGNRDARERCPVLASGPIEEEVPGQRRMASERELAAEHRHAHIWTGRQAERLELPGDLEGLGDRRGDRVQLDPDGTARERDTRRQGEAGCVDLEAPGDAPPRDEELTLGVADIDEGRGARADVEAQVLHRHLHHPLARRAGALLQREIAIQRLTGNREGNGRAAEADEAIRGIRGVDGTREGAGDHDARHVDGDAPGERARDSGRRDREARGRVADADQAVAEIQAAVGDGELNVGGPLGEREIAGQGLTEDGDADPVAGESHVRTGRQTEQKLAAADAQHLIDDLGRLIDLDRDVSGGSNTRDVDGHAAGELAGGAGRRDDEGAAAVGQRENVAGADADRERDVAGRHPNHRRGVFVDDPVEGEIPCEGLPRDVQHGARRLDPSVGPGRKIEGDHRGADGERLRDRRGGRVDGDVDTGEREGGRVRVEVGRELAGEPRRADEQAPPALIDREERRRAVADAQRDLIGRQSRDLLSARHRQLLEDEVAAQRLAEGRQRRRRGADAGELDVRARRQPTRHEGGADRSVRRIQEELEAAAERHTGHVGVHGAAERPGHAVAEEQELSSAFREPDELRGAIAEREAGMAGRELDGALVIGPIGRGVVGIEEDFFEPEVRGDHLSQDRQPEPQPAELDEGPGGVGLLGRAELHEDLMVGADRKCLVQRLREAVEANPGGTRDPDVGYPDHL